MDDDERAKFNLGRSEITGGGGETNIINEPGLYSLVLGSRKPEAKAFKRWITHEVIPAIRKHGGYLTPEKIEEALLNPDTIIHLATQLKDEQGKRRALEAKVTEDRPKVMFADAVSASPDSTFVGELAKILRQNGVQTGQNRLFELLREEGYLCSSRGERWNQPTQRAMEMGLFEIKKNMILTRDGPQEKRPTVKVTGKGQVYFVNKLLAAQAADAN